MASSSSILAAALLAPSSVTSVKMKEEPLIELETGDVVNMVGLDVDVIPGLPVTSKPDVLSDAFAVDRSRIEAVGEADQAEELQSLGLSVYDQTTLEQGILDQVDQALIEQDRRKLDTEIQNVIDDISSCDQQLKKSELLFLKSTAKESLSIRNDINNRRKQLQTLKLRQETLNKKRNLLTDGEILEKSHEGKTVKQASLVKIVDGGHKGETERERQIRLGEMTPFGTIVGTGLNKPTGGLSEFDKYLQSQAKLQSNQKKERNLKRKSHVKETSSKSEVTEVTKRVKLESMIKKKLKKNIKSPKKRRPKELLGSSTSSNTWTPKPHGSLLSERTELEMSGSEYHPSDSDDYDEERGQVVSVTKSRSKPQRKVRKEIESWGTDDSDWESSDEEGIARRRRSGKKTPDDGNLLDFKDRMILWKEEKKKSGEGEEETYHDLDMGFRVPKSLWVKLYKYQQVGVQWLWELHQQRCGGILGDEMGLGKTIQIIGFFAGLSVSPVTDRHLCFQGLGPCLIVCPTTVMHQWVREFHTWYPPCRVSVLHESGSHIGKREALITGLGSGSVLVTSYSGVVQHKDALLKRDWHYVVLDEGHKIRNPDAQVTITCKMFRTPHRIILSGSPMQNHLKELWSLFDFIFPGKLGTLPVFMAQLAVPITQGGYANASQVQVATAYRCATVLRDTISPYLLRRLKPDVQTHVQLPSKSEQVLFCRLTDEQRSLYKSYLESGDVERIIDGRMKVFVGLIHLRKICNHPDIYSGGPKIMRWENEDELTEEQRYGFWRRAGKMLVIESLLKIWFKQKHRVLLFTQSRQMLTILEAFVLRQGYNYLKMDGQTSISSRQPLVNKYNSDPSIFVFLLTTRVGGLGVNLTGADRVVIYDPDWNPATDTQARERAWRIGQKNKVTVYRLVTAGTIEEKIYHRQIFKQFLTNKVLRDPRQRRFFKTNDLFELFTLKDEDEGGSTETAAIFAGTNSEVKVNMASKERQKKAPSFSTMPKKPSAASSSLSSTKAQLKKMKQLAELTKKPETVTSSVSFSQTKLDHMKKLAQLLSQKIGTKDGIKPAEEGGKLDVSALEVKIEDTEKTENCDENNMAVSELPVVKPLKEAKIEKDINILGPSSSAEKKGKREKPRHRKHKSKRRELGAKFEGERVPYLVKHREAKTEKEEEEKNAKDDNYVLKKLFQKSGLHEVLHHDVIIGEGDPDYALVEGEAKRVAQEAVKALKESRRLCWQADTGVPSWTGQSGALKTSRPRFGKKQSTATVVQSLPDKEKPSTSSIQTTPMSSVQTGPMSSQELITRMKERNRLTSTLDPSDVNDVSDQNSELLTDVRNFIAFGGSIDNSASTQEILDKFAEKLPKGMSPLFKCLLEEVAEFHRMSSGQGMWKLRSEFRW